MNESNSALSRRKFLYSSAGLLATAGMATLTPGVVAAASATEKKAAAGEITYRTLGKTGLKLPIVSMGAGACNDPGLVQACYEIGMRHFDTAANYGYGRNEQMVSRAIDRLKVRDKIIIASKVHTPDQRNGLTPERSKKRLIDSVEASLRRLKTDYLDILYVHAIEEAEEVHDEAIIEALLQVKKEGKVRFVGTSFHTDMANVMNATIDAGVYDVALVAINFTMADDTDLLKAIARASKTGIGVIAMKTQAGGTSFPNPETIREYDGSVINSAALKWALKNEYITTAITGIDTHEHMRFNFAIASNLELTEMETKFLTDNKAKLGIGFCRQCKSCLASCPRGVDVPKLMRTHMYAAQYSDFQKARITLNEIPTNRGLGNCTSCQTCLADCANTVDIDKRINNLRLMYV